MAKVNANLSEYTHAGDFTWKEASENGKAMGVLAVNPTEEMFDPQGYKKEIANKATKTYITVHYDIDYVHEFIHKRILLSCGFMRGTKLNEDGLRKFMDQQVTYSLTENTRIAEAKLIRDAQDMADSYGGTIEYWTETLKKAALVNNQKPEASNGKVKEKVAA